MQFSVWYNIDNERNKKGGSNEKEVMIKITVTDDIITLDGVNLGQLSKDAIIDSIKVIVSLAKTLGILWEGDSTKWKCVNSLSRFTRTAN